MIHVIDGCVVLIHAIYRYVKDNIKYMKDCARNKESSYLKNWDVNNLYGCSMSPINDFE